ncbi:MAG: Fic family protein [Spirochaetota bacterium]|nr:Fic family protein [Spirochaetota bacterium]
MNQYNPPFQVTRLMLRKVAEMSEMVGRWSASKQGLNPGLRRENRVRSIQASLAIENNSLSVNEVTAVLSGQKVLGPAREIQEVKNAFSAYEGMNNWSPSSEKDLLKAHDVMMRGLIDDSGVYRQGDVGIYQGQEVVHMAPGAKRVPFLMADLFEWLARTEDHPLIASCVFHYELEFIHPFSDGNGRMGRLWQTLILSRWHEELGYLPVETVIKEKQEGYYQSLAMADKAGESTVFIEFLLEALFEVMNETITVKRSGKVSEKTSEKILREMGQKSSITITELSTVLGVSTRSVERNIRHLQDIGLLKRIGSARSGHWEVVGD